jgi:hypothetical protein
MIAEVHVISFQSKPFLELRNNDTDSDDDAGTNAIYKGFIIDLLDEVTSEVEDVDYEIVLSEDGLYGSRMANDKWNGMIGMIQKGVSTDTITHGALTRALLWMRW